MREKNFLDESDKNDLTTWTKWLFTLILLTHNFAENGLTSDDTGASFSAAMGMNVLAGSAVMSLTLIWPSVIAFGSYDLAVDNDTTLPHIPGEEPSFIKKLSGCYISQISYTEYKQPDITSQTYGVTTDSETSHTARIMLVSMIPFVILQLPKIINVTTVTREIVLLTLILTSAFFIGYAVYQGADEEQLPLIPKKKNFNDDGLIWEYLKALALVLSGTVVTALIALPLIMNVSGFATDANIPSFLIPYVIIPCAINIPRLLSTINSAGHKTQRAVSLTLSQIYSGVFMSNMSSLTTFLLTVYIRDLPWDVSAEVLVVLIICGVMGIFTSTRTIFPLWTGYLGYMLYPTSLLMLYLFTNVWGWP
ncbi:hypothetical protein HanHA89_Chr04g0156761 [Helianthus annuus]|nr:hypothetical protein HanHA89_Chr04g0156761 [Helianthus annuus]